MSAKILGPLFTFEVTELPQTDFLVKTARNNDGETIASIEVPTIQGTQRYEARHQSRMQAISDVQAAVEQDMRTGKLRPGNV